MILFQSFSPYLLDWFAKNGRTDLPWQKNCTPYRVWVSEIMLQQTQVSSVIPFYERFMFELPTLESLARAEQDKVLHLWAGLGYYARARNLHQCSKIICNDYGGQFPDDVVTLQTLPGIGRSTAGAILSLSMGKRAAILDGNVKRVLCRYHNVRGWPGSSKTGRELWELADMHTPKDRVAEYTQAIMDLGATCCTRNKPECPRCPIALTCQANQKGIQHALPERRLTKKKPKKIRWWAVITRDPAEVLLQKRPSHGIWGGLWTPPEFTIERQATEWIESQNESLEKPNKVDPPIFHSFSHFDLEAIQIRAHLSRHREKIDPLNLSHGALRWFSLEPPPIIGLPAPVAKLLETLVKKL